MILWIPMWRHFTVFCLFSSASLEAGGCPEIGKHPLSSPLCWQISIQTDTTAPASRSTRPRSTCRYSTVSAVSFQLREFLLYSLLSLNPPPFTDPHKHVMCKVEWTRTRWRQYSILLELQQKPSNKHYVPLSKREKSQRAVGVFQPCNSLDHFMFYLKNFCEQLEVKYLPAALSLLFPSF